MHGFDPIRWAIPIFVIMIIGEMFWAKARAPQSYEPRDTLTSLALGLGSTALGLLTAGAIYAASLWLYQFRLTTFGWQWWTWAAAFV